jgi:hypothetical protein
VVKVDRSGLNEHHPIVARLYQSIDRVLTAVGEHTTGLEILIVRHRASGWVREIARKNEDQPIEAEFDPETGIVTVYEGRRDFRELERAARRAGLSKRRAPDENGPA